MNAADRFANTFGARRGTVPQEPSRRSAGALRWCPRCSAQFGHVQRCAWCEVPLVPFADFADWAAPEPLQLTVSGIELRFSLRTAADLSAGVLVETAHGEAPGKLVELNLAYARDIAAGTRRYVSRQNVFDVEQLKFGERDIQLFEPDNTGLREQFADWLGSYC